MELFIVVVMICLAVSFALSLFSERLGIPTVIGQIIAGMVLAIPFIKGFIIHQEGLVLIRQFSEFGIIFLLLLAGMETDVLKLRKYEKDIFFIAFFAAIVPFLLGYGVMKLLGYSNIVSLILGVSLSLTSEGTKLKALLDFDVLKTKLGNIMLGAGIADDIFEMLFLAFILFLAESGTGNLAALPFKIIAFIALTYLIVKAIPKLANVIKLERTEVGEFSLLLVITLFIASSSALFGFGPIVGAFIAGIIVQYAMSKKEEFKMIKDLKVLGFGFIVPFFFINIGLQFNPSALVNYFGLFVLIVCIATISKIIGTLMAVPFSSLTYHQGWLVGWGMNSRGAVELIIAEVARVNGLIGVEIYSIIVGMTIFTTILFPFVLKYYLKRYPRIMG